MTAAAFFPNIQKHCTFERIVIILFLAGLILRLYHLDLKLFHHDEAIHAWFSFRLLTEGTYQYDPTYHGPFLYYITAGMFAFLGDSDLVGRLVPAVLGALLVLLVYPLYRLGYLGFRQAVVAALFLALSPNMVYFSRFLRNDIFIAFFTLLLLVSLLLYFERQQGRYALIAAAAAAGGMSSKENMPIVILIFGAYLVFLLWKGKLKLPLTWKRDIIAGFVLIVGIMALFYSSFGQHPEILLDGWLRAIEHWTSMHQAQRLGGPPYFYLMLLLLYEVPIVVLAIIGTGQFIRGDRPLRFPWRKEPSEGIEEKENVLDYEDSNRSPERELHSLARCDKSAEFTRFCIIWMLVSLGIYAYIGEKVPWLLLHQLLPMIFVAVYRMADWKWYLSLASVIFLVGMTWHVAFVAEDISEPIVQVQNSEELRDVMALIDESGRVAIVTDHYWPIPWYYRGEQGSRFTYLNSPPEEEYFASQTYDLIIAHDMNSYPSLEGYEKRTYRSNYWFSTYENKDRWLEYYFKRDGVIGSRNWDVFISTA